MTSRPIRIVLLVLCSAAIMVLSLIPNPPFRMDWFAGMDKVQHWIAYSALGFLVFVTIHAPGRHRLLGFAVTVFACTAYGGLIEVLQSFTGRVADPIDCFVNMFGAAVGSIAALGFVETSLDSRRRGQRDRE